MRKVDKIIHKILIGVILILLFSFGFYKLVDFSFNKQINLSENKIEGIKREKEDIPYTTVKPKNPEAGAQYVDPKTDVLYLYDGEKKE
jgi:cell division protein FtsL